ncbi:RNA polymerase sigma-70 factor (ECF subfamily) [Kibdelosporangium banguiense]|uniref:RNA polymerase sigma-70 factor (ECF subfamily) n=1 Tax=Kibdelosporangium banguiense TaxID=1365924 RepID=A0ABS4TRX6_9PSEU|nr:RNA polymerase sigma factor SigJ [Kibdelosporangium banguiense]MBP2327147.1 RNA polymerase sigma-70 factor (ECF subfamily) [Kibdelosporangium banguiense]
MQADPARVDAFEQYRDLMFGISYRMLGTVADAEDTIQETWLRWNQIDRDSVVDPRGYLVRAVTRTSIDQLRRAKARREQYVGSWLPEPLLTGPDSAESVALADSVSMAILVMLERLSPLERAVFVLREVFGFSFPEVAQAIDRSEAAVRQLGRRARANVRGRPRFTADSMQTRQITERFLAACLGGDLGGLMELLAPDVTMYVDSNGRSEGGPLQPVYGAQAIAGYFASVAGRFPAGIRSRYVELNGSGSGLLVVGDEVYAAFVLDFAPGPDGRVAAVWVIREEGKLSRIPVPQDS